ncbi:MAG: hypothetical protein M1277_00530 [Patescibacteria group bacterium]|nr:hypothetical protein [Patescibacteria group bacterium]
MDEKEFSDKLLTILRKHFPEYVVSQGKSLLYKINIDPNGKLKPANIEKPSRGQFAFQTDLLISNKKVPLVVLELKFGGFSTHDVITYSTKAIRHKEIYPYLRYGFVVGGQKFIDGKFFTHNVGFDFAYTLDRNYGNGKFIKLIKEQIKMSEKLIKILSGNKVSKYTTSIEIE